jgi:hypothetical protein
MAKVKQTDSVGRDIWVDTSTGRAYTEGGNRDTYYSIDEWNARQLKNASQGKASYQKKDKKKENDKPTYYAPIGMPEEQKIDLSSLYEKYFNTEEIKAKETEASDIEKKRDDAITSMQNNPWFSQATRGGKIGAIRSDSERNLERINNELTRLQTDAQIQYNIQLQQYDINRQAYQDSLNLFNSLVSSGAIENASSSDIAKLSVQTGIPTSMINSIIQTSKTSKLTTQSYEDDSGQYLLYVDPSGNIVNKTFLGKGKSNPSGVTGVNAYGYIPGASSESPYKTVLSSPPMSARPGTVMEYPSGSGIFWTAGSDGSWK